MYVRSTLAALLLTATIGCGKSSTTSPTTPTPASTTAAPSGCAITLTPSTQQVGIAGGTFTATATTNSGCAWTASRLDNWVIVIGPSGAVANGNGTITYTVQPNNDVGRTGTIVVRTSGGTASVAVSQDASTTECRYTINPSAQSVGSRGGSFTFKATRNTPNGCAWAASTSTPWISLTGPVTGLSPGTISYSVAANGSSASRTGAILLEWHGGGAQFVVQQAR